jgi:hypothetical protein
MTADRSKAIDELLTGAVDLHCHSGPSVMPRRIDHIEASKQAAEAGLKAILFKDHYYSVTPIAALLTDHFQDLNLQFLSGLALNNSVGGFNRYAVDHAIKLGANLIWMPTFSSQNHLDEHKRDKDFEEKFPTTKEQMLAPTPLRAVDEAGNVLDEVKFILDLIAEHDLVLSSGHLHISEIWPLFDEAKARGVKRLLVNHPTYVVGASLEDITKLVEAGAYVEHSMCMFDERSKYKFYDPEDLDAMIKAAGVERTILGSDLGQVDNPLPVEGFRLVIGLCLDLGYAPEDIRQMISSNACDLMGLD